MALLARVLYYQNSWQTQFLHWQSVKINKYLNDHKQEMGFKKLLNDIMMTSLKRHNILKVACCSTDCDFWRLIASVQPFSFRQFSYLDLNGKLLHFFLNFSQLSVISREFSELSGCYGDYVTRVQLPVLNTVLTPDDLQQTRILLE